jgi:hypothetical protein
MDEISNKTLAILLISAIVVSLGGTLISLNRLASIRSPITGLAIDDTATVELDIKSVAEVNFTTGSINWGTGTVDAGRRCALNSHSASLNDNCTDFTTQENGLILENIGNKNLTLAIYMGKTAATFIDGTDPIYQFNVSNSEADSCTADSLEVVEGQWYDAVLQASSITICNETDGGFRSGDSNDELRFDVRVVVPSDAIGAKSDVITADVEEI